MIPVSQSVAVHDVTFSTLVCTKMHLGSFSFEKFPGGDTEPPYGGATLSWIALRGCY